jgi:hypothetical protein
METIELQYPILVDGIELKTLRLRRPKVCDLRVMEREKTDMTKTVVLIANLAELAPEQLEEMDASDFARVNEVVTGFLGVESPLT